MKLNRFGREIWTRYLVHGLKRPLIYSLMGLVLIGVVDWFFRLSLLWRGATIVLVVAYLIKNYRQLILANKPPTLDELYHYACHYHGNTALDMDPHKLSLPKTLLKSWPKKELICIFIFLILPFFHPLGRLGLQRFFLLSGQWPKKTEISQLKFSPFVEEGTPVVIHFQTLGKIPRYVRLKINDQKKLLVSSGSANWSYDFFHPPGAVRLSIEAGDDWVDSFVIQVLKGPALVESSIAWKEPDYLGQNERMIKGLHAQIPESSQVTLKSQFRNVHSLKVNGHEVVLNPRGVYEYFFDQISQNERVTFSARAHGSLPFRDVAKIHLDILRDNPPSLIVANQQDLTYVLKNSSIEIQAACEDDYGLTLLEITTQDHQPIYKNLTGRRDIIFCPFELSEFRENQSNKLSFGLRVRDNKNQWSVPQTLMIQIVDQDIFQQRLMEHQQHMHRQLEDLIASSTRRLKRYQRQQLLDPQAESNNIRDDLEKNEQLISSYERYLKKLRQLEGFENQVLESSQDLHFFKKSLDNYLESLLILRDATTERQQAMIQRMNEISIRLSRSQDIHLVLRLLDKMIQNQKVVLDDIPPID